MSHYQPYTYTPAPPGGTLQEPVTPSRLEEPIGLVPPLTPPQDTHAHGRQPHGLPPAPPVALDNEEPVAGPPAASPHGLRTEPQPVYSPQADVPVPPTYFPFPTTVLRTVPEGSTYAGLPAYPTGVLGSSDRSPLGFPTLEHPRGTTVLVFGIIGLIVFQPLAIAAWVMGRRAKKEIGAGQYAPTSTVSIGRVLGIIGTILFILEVLLVIALIILFFLRREIVLGWFQ